jgi:hypothetical protein
MFELTAYMDETGHSKDERQKFVGMAGLIATARDWEQFERKWKETLKSFRIPFFHMKDFASLRGPFKGWSEIKRRKLLDKLLRIIATTYAMPFGAVIAMDDYRQLSEEEQGYFEDPYFLAFASCGVATIMLMAPMPREEKLRMVFSEQMEFRNRALKLYEKVRRVHHIGEKLGSPEFSDMREVVPLQGADLVAYELYKEFDRLRYRPTAQQRYGYVELLRIGLRSASFHPITFHSKDSLNEIVRVAKGGDPSYKLFAPR